MIPDGTYKAYAIRITNIFDEVEDLKISGNYQATSKWLGGGKYKVKTFGIGKYVLNGEMFPLGCPTESIYEIEIDDDGKEINQKRIKDDGTPEAQDVPEEFQDFIKDSVDTEYRWTGEVLVISTKVMFFGYEQSTKLYFRKI